MNEFYDKMLVNKANALGKKFGARVGQSEVDQPGGIGQWTYRGPDLSSHEILAAADKADSVSIERQLRDIAESVKRNGEGSPEGLPLKDAVEKHGSYAAAEALGGELTNAVKKQLVHVLPITPELRQAAARGFPLFSMGLALPGAPPLDDRAAKALATKPPDVGQYR